MNPSTLDIVFRAYDIRGTYPDQLDKEFYYNLGKAYVTVFSPKRLAVAHDIRPESLAMKYALSEGILDSGVDVVDLGEIATEMLYFAVGEYSQQLDGGLIVTASHNPSGWVGCKMVGPNVYPIGESSGLLDMKTVMENGTYAPVPATKGGLSDLDIFPYYKEKVLSFLNRKNEKKLKIVVDAGNGIGGKIFDYVFGDLPLEVTRLFFVPDGRYPHHVPNPILNENVQTIRIMESESGFDLGLAIDGDSDRIFILDKNGRKPSGVYLGAMLARYLLSNTPNSAIVHDPRIIWPITKELSKYKGNAIISKAGHTNFKQAMKEHEALFGVEMSGHCYYRDFFCADSGMITIALIFSMLFEGIDIEKELDYFYETYPISGEVNYAIRDMGEVLARVKATYKSKDCKIAFEDGISVEFTDWRFNLRGSNTEAKLRLNVEAINTTLLKEKFDEVEKLIGVMRENEPEFA